MLVLKALGIALIYLLCFGPWNGLEPSAASMFRHLTSPVGQGASETGHD